MNKRISARQELFCREYVKNFNGTEAARAAGYSRKGLTSIASMNLAKAHIQARVAELMDERNKAVQIDAEYVLRRLKDIDELDALDIVDDRGYLLPLKQWPKIWRTSVSGVEIGGKGQVSKIKWPDKVKNLEMIGKHTKVDAWTIDKDGIDDDVQPLEITFNVETAKGPIKVRNGVKPK